METYSYTITTDFLDQSTSIEFQPSGDYKEFLKQLLQILGMYNFLIKDHQDIWQNNEASVKIAAPNGIIILRIHPQKSISFLANDNQKDLLKIETILSKFSVFSKEELQLVASA